MALWDRWFTVIVFLSSCVAALPFAKSEADNGDDPESRPEFVHQAKLTFCSLMKRTQLGQNLYRRERLDEFCVLKVRLFSTTTTTTSDTTTTSNSTKTAYQASH